MRFMIPAVFLYSARSRESRQITFPPQDSNGDADPAISPDGRYLGFRRTFNAGNGDVFLTTVPALAPARQVTFQQVDGFAWVANRSIQVPTLAGIRALALDRDRLVYRLKGQGFPVTQSGARGDQEVTVKPVFPDRLSADQEILLDQLVATHSGGEGTDERLRAWQRSLRAWERGLDAAP